MKAIRTKVCAYAVVLLASLGLATTPSLGGSSDFSGIYGALHASVNGVGLDGTYTDSNDETTNGMIGAFVPAGGAEIGVNIPLGDVFFLGVGVTQIAGQADVAVSDDYEDNNDWAATVSNLRTWYIQPSVSLWDNSAIYVKVGNADGQFDVYDQTGAEACDPTDQCELSGRTYAIGTTTIANSGLFIKTEAGAIQYDQFKITGIGGDTDRVVEGDPLVGYGHVSIGYKL
jgi:hypothetical protein